MARSQRTPVIIDTDPGVDDAIAILFALASPELEILGYIITYGNTDLDSCYRNIFKIYHAVSRHVEKHPQDRERFPNLYSDTKPFVAYGAREPIAGDIHGAQHFHGKDGLSNITWQNPELDFELKDGRPYHSQLQPIDKPGAELAIELLRSRPERSITYIAIGPLTTLAEAVRLDGTTVRERVGRVISMGGALDVPGNATPVAEFNWFADPYAVKELLDHTDPEKAFPLERFIFLPLDITAQHELPFPLYEKIVDTAFGSTDAKALAKSKTPIVHFTSSILQRCRKVMLDFGKDAMELHDIVAVWCAIENPPVPHEKDSILELQTGWRGISRKFEIERTGEYTRGMLVVDRREDPLAYAPGRNRAAVQAELEKQQVHIGLLESTAVPAEVEVDRPVEKFRVGVASLIETPGSAVMLNFLMKRVWGVQTMK